MARNARPSRPGRRPHGDRWHLMNVFTFAAALLVLLFLGQPMLRSMQPQAAQRSSESVAKLKRVDPAMKQLAFCAARSGAAEGRGPEAADLTLQAVAVFSAAGHRASAHGLPSQVNPHRSKCDVLRPEWLDAATFVEAPAPGPEATAGEEAPVVPPGTQAPPRGRAVAGLGRSFCAPGELTPMGFDQAVLSGQRIAAAYAEHPRLALAVSPTRAAAARLVHVVAQNTTASREAAVALLGGLGFALEEGRAEGRAEAAVEEPPPERDQVAAGDTIIDVAGQGERRLRGGSEKTLAPPIFVMGAAQLGLRLPAALNTTLAQPRGCARIELLRAKQLATFPVPADPDEVAAEAPAEGGGAVVPSPVSGGVAAISKLKTTRDVSTVPPPEAEEAEKIRAQVQRSYTIFSILFGPSVRDMGPQELADAVLTGACAAAPLPCGPHRCAIANDVEGLYALARAHSCALAQGREGGRRAAELQAYPLVQELSEYLGRIARVERESSVLASAREGAKAEEEEDASWALRPGMQEPEALPRLLMASVEPELLLVLLSALGVAPAPRNGTVPPCEPPAYAARLVFELWTRPGTGVQGEFAATQDIFVRLLYDGRPVTAELEACGNEVSPELCPLPQIRQLVGKWLGKATTYAEACVPSSGGKIRQSINDASNLLMDSMGG